MRVKLSSIPHFIFSVIGVIGLTVAAIAYTAWVGGYVVYKKLRGQGDDLR